MPKIIWKKCLKLLQLVKDINLRFKNITEPKQNRLKETYAQTHHNHTSENF